MFDQTTKARLYVDKTEMITCLNAVVMTPQKYVCVSRPRRFGKTYAADMVSAYYDRTANSAELFSKRKLAGTAPVENGYGLLAWDSYLGRFDVIRLTMTEFFNKRSTIEKGLSKMQRLVVRELKEAYPDANYLDESDLVQSVRDSYRASGRQFVFVIDEWDAVFRTSNFDSDDQELYLDFLRDLLKDKEYVALAYMTGILPIKKYGGHSALNMFREYSMMDPAELAPYTGFTEGEVKGLCDRYGCDFARVKEWYDGYEVCGVAPVPEGAGPRGEAPRYSLYCPLSVREAVTRDKVANYWNQTETYEALANYIRRDFDGLRQMVAVMMGGGRLKIDVSTYANDMDTFQSADDVLTLLVHLGYLAFDEKTSEVRIPNKEILDVFRTSTKGADWKEVFDSLEASKELLEATWAMDAERVAALLEEAHDRAGNLTYNDEAALAYAVRSAYYAAEAYYTVIPELDSGKGYADIAFLPQPEHADRPALVVELKYDRDADTALSQIRSRNYPARLRHYANNMLLVGVNYDREVPAGSPGYKHHTCVIERA
jgi:hypothetical protein